MPRGVKNDANGEKLSATERRLKRIQERREAMANSESLPVDEVFERCAKASAKAARGIAYAVRDWMNGDIEATDELMLTVRANYSDLVRSLTQLDVAHKAISGK